MTEVLIVLNCVDIKITIAFSQKKIKILSAFFFLTAAEALFNIAFQIELLLVEFLKFKFEFLLVETK